MTIILATLLLFSAIFLLIVLIADLCITNKKLKRNQFLWDEFSRNMTKEQKLDAFDKWLEENRLKHGEYFYYIPKM